MAKIIQNRTVVEDPWVRVEDDAPLPTQGPILVPLERWLREGSALAERPEGAGVWLKGEDDARALVGRLEGARLVALHFEGFRDGRGYSQATLLRRDAGYAGELRAVGDVLRDQLSFLWRCGVDSFEVRADKDPHDALKAFETFSVQYQGDAREAAPLYRRATLPSPG